MMLRKILVGVALCSVTIGGVVAGSPPLAESFDLPLAQLKAEGWKLPANASVCTEVVKEGTGALRLDVNDKTRPDKYAEYFFPVQAGKCYQGEIWIKTKGVSRRYSGNKTRGAVLFLEWADSLKKHVSGGSFPIGLEGDRDWTLFKVPCTAPIPSNVAFIRVLVGIEGNGSAWFDGLKVSEISAGNWSGPVIVAPRDGQIFHTQRPEIIWKKIGIDGFYYRLEFSRRSTFDPAETIKQFSESSAVRPDVFLTPGLWHCRIVTYHGGRDLPVPRSVRFEIAPDAVAWPVSITPDWKWSAESRPLLKFLWIEPPRHQIELKITVDNHHAEIVEKNKRMVSFRPSVDLPPGVHDIRIEAAMPGQPVLTVSGIFCNRQPGSKVTFRADRVMLVDGTPFFALGTYRDPSDKIMQFEGILKAGFNLTHDYAFEHKPQTVEFARRYLDAAHAAGLKVFMGLPRSKIAEHDYPWIQRWVAALMDHPALLLWYMIDEPEIRDIMPIELRKVNRVVKNIDPFHPTAVVYCKNRTFSDWTDCQDLFCHDPYPLPKNPVTEVEDDVAQGRNAIGASLPMWTVLQAHDLRFYRTSKADAFRKYGNPDQPSREQTRCMAFLALAAGTDGLIWYWLPKTSYDIVKDAAKPWAGIVDTVQLFKRLEPWLTAGNDRAAEGIAVPEPFRVWSRRANGQRVLALVNSSEKTALLKLDLSKFAPAEVKDFESGLPVVLDHYRCDVSLAPLEVKILSFAEKNRAK